MAIKGSLQVSVAIVNTFSDAKFLVPSKICPKFPFEGNWDKNVQFFFRSHSKATSLRETTSSNAVTVKIGVGA